MVKTAQQIADDINNHLQKDSVTHYSAYYIGITNDIERRLFNEHNVSKEGHWFIYRKAISKAAAQAVEEHFLNKGMQGDTGGGSDDTTWVYCYRISNQTKE